MLTYNSNFDTPTDFDQMFGRSAPLVLEVGFGDGRYLEHLAQAHPEWNLIGAEVSLGSVWRAYRRMKRCGAAHVRLYKGSGRFVVRDVMPEQKLHRVYVNFPDPWPRKKHLKNRLLQAPFFQILSSRLEPGGDLLLTTDHPEYFAFSVEQGKASGCFDVEEGTPPPATLKTKYAMKWLEQDKPIYHARFTVNKVADAPEPRNTQIPMQHAILDGNLSDVSSFEKKVRPFDGGHAIILEAYRDLSSDGLLFKAVSEEPDLRQELMIQAWPHEDGGVLVSLQPFGNPMTTKGVREAVMAVSDWLVGQGLTLRKAWV
ncbi:MAG: tRNA (guanosine(46)-N7)-methyltransferase TrmB [Rhodothermales bacterium]